MPKANTRSRLLLVTLLPALALSMAVGCASTPTSGVQSDGSFRETFEAFAISMGTSNPPVIPRGQNATLQINITRWTTEEEREGYARLEEWLGGASRDVVVRGRVHPHPDSPSGLTVRKFRLAQR